MKTVYFLDVYCDGEYTWRDHLECLPKEMKSRAERFLNRKIFTFAKRSLKIVVREFESENTVFEFERPVQHAGG